jgi:hypothetical protein
MKTLDLNAYGVTEMNELQMQEVDGGCPLLAFALGFLVGAAIGLYEILK